MRALLVVHDFDAETGAPSVPATWTVGRIGDRPWYALTHPSGRTVLAWRENEHGPSGLALWAILGEAEDLAELDSRVETSMPAREMWRRRTQPAARSRLRWWRTLRCSGQERIDGSPTPFTDEVRTLVPRGVQLPDPALNALPWNLAADGSLTTPANAVIRVESFSGADTLAMAITLAGHRYDRGFADEEDPGA